MMQLQHHMKMRAVDVMEESAMHTNAVFFYYNIIYYLFASCHTSRRMQLHPLE